MDESQLLIPPPVRPAGVTIHWILGVALPSVALVTEVLTGMSASIYVNPLPTWWHVLLVAWVPASVAWTLTGAQRSDRWRRQSLPVLAIGWGIALCYAVAFAPIAVVGVMGLVFLGLGLLPLSPALVSIAGGRLLFKSVAATGGWRGRVSGLVAAVVLGAALPVLPFVPGLIVRWCSVGMADTGKPRLLTLDQLRAWGPRDSLLLTEDFLASTSGEWNGWAGGSRIADLSMAWYRIHGEPMPRPEPQGPARMRVAQNRAWWEWDADQGSNRVGAPVRDLGLQDSEMAVVMYPEAAVGYAEWALVFRNDAKFGQAEARALIGLPRGGVVSRLTLWIDGEPHEAAFGGKSQTTQAYQRVVARRRDPVLVTWSAEDEVMLQCFPVPAAGGTMKVRMGVSFPVEPNGSGGGTVQLPYLRVTNFAVEDDLRTRLTGSGVASRVDTAPLMEGKVVAVANLAEACRVSVSDWDGRSTILRWQIVEEAPPQGVLRVVVDGGARMAGWREALAEALRQLPATQGVAIYFAGDRVEESGEMPAVMAAEWLLARRFVGGQDSTAALTVAAKAARVSMGADRLVWLQGGQSCAWGRLSELTQALSDLLPTWWQVIRVGGAHNVLREQLREVPGAAPREVAALTATDSGRLRAALEAVMAGRSAYVASPDEAGAEDVTRIVGTAAQHVERVWVAREVARRLEQDDRWSERLRNWAVGLQLVTPVSGAVVLEQRQQYEEAGLKQIDPMSAPAVPEPETYALWFMAIVLAFVVWRRRRRAAV